MSAHITRNVVERRRVMIRGRVQGVYFRETVRQIAARHAVAGFVRNVGRDLVELHAEGAAEAVAAFIAEVLASPPPAAVVDDVRHETLPPTGETGFSVQRTIGR